jgi:tripartite-type tricarboxylate transporter receptor subunit TctC
MNTPELRDRLADLSVEGTSLDPAATAAFVGREITHWRQVVRDNNVTAS